MDFGKKRLGNWIVTKYLKNGVPFIQVKPVSGEHCWEYSSLDGMFLTLEHAIDNEASHNGLETCFGIMSGFIHVSDPVFYDLYIKCLEEYGKLAERRKPQSQEDEREIIKEMQVRYELDEALKELDGEEGKTEESV